ncbi:MAG: hypothetical protein E7620_06220 [Ruminococcaceae bacterium]|nr:hypothetical protein [Oscillospiraceae bacterium]
MVRNSIGKDIPMKKSNLIALALLLAMTCLTTSCSFSPVEDSKIPLLDYQNTTEGSNEATAPVTSAPRVPSDPLSIVGKWSSSSVPLMFQFYSDNTLTCFFLAPGYYEYSESAKGTYTYDGLTLHYTLEGEEAVSLSCSVENGMMLLNTQYRFDPVEELPKLHPTYVFPDYDALAQKYPLANGSYTGNTIPTTLRADTLAEMAKAYWVNQPKNTWVKRTEGVAKLGDFVNIDYSGKLGDVVFEGGTAVNQIIEVNDGTGMIDGFCVGVAGHKVGDTFDVPVTFPEQYHSAELAGKDVIFTMTLNGIYEFTLTDEIAKENKYDSLDAWVTAEYELALEKKVFELIPDLNVEIPEEAYIFFYQYYLDQIHSNAFYYFNNNMETCLAYFGTTLEQLKQDSVDLAKIYLQSAQIAAKYQLVAEESLVEEVRKELIAAYTGSGYTEEQAKEMLEGEGKNEFRAYVLESMISEYLIKNNTFTEATEH